MEPNWLTKYPWQIRRDKLVLSIDSLPLRLPTNVSDFKLGRVLEQMKLSTATALRDTLVLRLDSSKTGSCMPTKQDIEWHENPDALNKHKGEQFMARESNSWRIGARLLDMQHVFAI